MELAAPELEAGDDAQLEHQAVGAIEVDELTTGEAQNPREEKARHTVIVQPDYQSNAGGVGSSEGRDDNLARTAAGGEGVENASPLSAPLPIPSVPYGCACADIRQT